MIVRFLLHSFLFLSLLVHNVHAQPKIEWQKCLGGGDNDIAYSIEQTTDGGYIVAGETASNDGDVTDFNGESDYWIVKLSSSVAIEWQKCLGGESYDVPKSIIQTTEGGYIVAGYSLSNDGDVSGNHGAYDYWIVKLSSSGMIEWQKSLGGSNSDQAVSIIQAADSSYLVAGYSFSNDGDVSGNHGDRDYWIVKLSSSGDIVWQKCLGGSGEDYALSIKQTVGGGYIVAGYSESNDGDVSGNHGESDYWIVKLSSSGDIVWQKCLGGSNIDQPYSIIQTVDGGYSVAGYSLSNDGDVSGNHGISDYWIVKLDSIGEIEWQKCLGGKKEEEAKSIYQTSEGGFIIAGFSLSNDGDVSGNHGSRDYWIVELSSLGDIEWQKCLGGSGEDYAFSINQTVEGGYIVAGYSESNDGDVSGLHGLGFSDYWIVKLEPYSSLYSFSTVIHIYDSNESYQNLTFGTELDASDEYDSQYDIYAPPLPLAGAFDARLINEEEHYINDIREPISETIVWYLSYQPSFNVTEVTLTWDRSQLPDGHFELKDDITGDLLKVDMLTQDSITITDLDIDRLMIVFTIQQPFEQTLTNGWNMIGLPNDPSNTHYQSLYPNSINGTLYEFSGNYVSRDSIESGGGYWLRSQVDDTVEVNGYIIESLTLDLKEGWNMISGISKDMALSDVSDTGSIIIPNTLFGFGNSYFLSDSILQGQGYWIRADANGKITIADETLIPKIAFEHETDRNTLNAFQNINIGDARGRSQKLYIGTVEQSRYHKHSFTMPPVPPGNAFDVRFEGNRLLTSSEEVTIHIQAKEYPLTIRLEKPVNAEGTDYNLLEVIADRTGKTYNLVSGNTINITNPQVKKLRLSKMTSTGPLSFVVYQNYPNPFNPTTEIKYGLPNDSKVKINIYNALGQKIKTLVNENQKAGYHIVNWNGTNEDNNRLSSGIYFFRISAGRHQAIRKMILLN